jgi:hypothetical protein
MLLKRKSAPEESKVLLKTKSALDGIVLLKISAPEDKRSRSATSSSEATLSEVASSEAISSEAEDQLNLRNSRIQELCHGSKFIKGHQKFSGILQRSFQRSLKACACNFGRKR